MLAFDDFTLLKGTTEKAVPVLLLDKTRAKQFLKALGTVEQGFLKAQDFQGELGDCAHLYLSNPNPALRDLGLPKDYQGNAMVLCAESADHLFFAAKIKHFKADIYEILESVLDPAKDNAPMLDALTLGWGLETYRYKKSEALQMPKLVVPASVSEEILDLVRAAWLGRNLINDPANLLGPDELAKAADRVFASLDDKSDEIRVQSEIIAGEVLNQEYPCLASVGNGSDRAPRVFLGRALKNESYPTISLVGKGVVFDTGGYDIKPASSMRLMKKDMGGAALMLALAYMIIRSDIRLNVEIRLGCVENSVSGHAMRPGDVLNTRAGLTVEVGNTDAEGRLVLCDLITQASESEPDLILDGATLTGAARVGLGPDLPALFSNCDALARALQDFSHQSADPFWAMPLWDGYDAWLSSDVADICNLSSQPLGGAITAALFLKRFVPQERKWLHLDTFGWNDQAKPARPKGGEVLGLISLFRWLKSEPLQNTSRS